MAGSSTIRKSRSTSPLLREYDSLPEVLKWKYTPEEYLWLTREGRERLLEQETMPEAYED